MATDDNTNEPEDVSEAPQEIPKATKPRSRSPKKSPPKVGKPQNKCRSHSAPAKPVGPRLTPDKQNIFNVIELEQNHLNDIGHDVWRYAEEGGSEVLSAKRITDYLQHKGFHIFDYLDDYATAFRAEYSKEEQLGDRVKPNIGFLCEYNADGKNGHNQGHNLVAANCLTAAIGLQRVIGFSKKKLGMVTVIGCPSNLHKTCKKEMLDAGVFKDIDILITAYPANFTCLKPRFMASKKVAYTFMGRGIKQGIHNPWEVANPVNAVVMTQQNIATLRGTFDKDWQIKGVIPQAGMDPCQEPEQGTCYYDLRAPTQKGLDALAEKLQTCVEAAATASGCKYEELNIGISNIPNININMLSKLYRKNAKLNGFTFHDENKRIIQGPDEISFISHTIPVFKALYYCGTSVERGSDEFNQYTGSGEAEYMNIVQGKSLAMMAADIMLDKDLCGKILNDHKRITKQDNTGEGANLCPE